MSIVSLVKVTVYSLAEEKRDVLNRLQELGCLHLLPLYEEQQVSKTQHVTRTARDAFDFIKNSPLRRSQSSKTNQFDPHAVEQEALKIKERMLILEQQRDFLKKRIEDVKQWGEFSFPDLKDLNGMRLWFYEIPHYQLKKLSELPYAWQEVKADNRFRYVVVISEHEPEGLGVARTHIGAKSLSTLNDELEEVQNEREELKTQRWRLTRWINLFNKNIHLLEDQEQLEDALQLTYDDSSISVIRGWAPKNRIEDLKNFAGENKVALTIEEPSEDDLPPTLMQNDSFAAGGVDLVNFFQTPSYWLWDPSTVVFYSFAVFFAMIMADAGYAAVMLVILAASWKKMGGSATGIRMRAIFSALVIFSLIYGIVAGSYFGIELPENSLLARFALFDATDISSMMATSVVIGVVHLILANIANAARMGRSAAALAPLGWASMLAGAIMYVAGSEERLNLQAAATAGLWLVGIGAVAVLLFTAPKAKPLFRILKGLMAFSKVTSAFGDVLSYLRLFALGMASASLAAAFNNLAMDVKEMPGVGILVALIILFVGHAINITLAVVSGVVHGLRLNYIEFFGWGVSEEGRPFKTFAKKEDLTWKHYS